MESRKRKFDEFSHQGEVQIHKGGPLKPEEWEAVYDAEISPLMNKIIEVCNRVGMPMLACYQLDRKEDGPWHKTLMCTTAIHLNNATSNDMFRAFEALRPSLGDIPFKIKVVAKDAEGNILYEDTVPASEHIMDFPIEDRE